MSLKELPVGRYAIDYILENNYLYVDKTEKIHQLITTGGGIYFLSRPRRFGKSLLISTLEQIFLGNKELFKDQWIYSSDYDWEEHPIIRLDMGENSSKSLEEMKEKINFALDKVAKKYDIELLAKIPELKFQELITKLHEMTQKHVVILVDEYDKPILDNIDNLETALEVRDFLRDFYTTIKSNDSHLRFIFLTGVSRFSKVSVFSGLNNMQDISMKAEYATIAGITQEELEKYFKDHIAKLAEEENKTNEETLEKIKKWYNGYRFTKKDVTVYNPYSTLQLFDNLSFDNYWFSSGTPTFLLKELKKTSYNLEEIIQEEQSKLEFDTYEVDDLNPVALLFQTGYLTISDLIEGEDTFYYLNFPNREVKKAFTTHLLSKITQESKSRSAQLVSKLSAALYANNIAGFFDNLKTFFANIPYDAVNLDKEQNFQVIFYTLFLLLGTNIETEVRTNQGRIDVVIQTGDTIYILELKLDSPAQEALEQIQQKEYYEKYQLTGKQIVLVGVSFSLATRNVEEYVVDRV